MFANYSLQDFAEYLEQYQVSRLPLNHSLQYIMVRFKINTFTLTMIILSNLRLMTNKISKMLNIFLIFTKKINLSAHKLQLIT